MYKNYKSWAGDNSFYLTLISILVMTSLFFSICEIWLLLLAFQKI